MKIVIIRKDRRVDGRHGGGGIYVRANLNFKIRNDLQSEILESLTVEIIKPPIKVNLGEHLVQSS